MTTFSFLNCRGEPIALGKAAKSRLVRAAWAYHRVHHEARGDCLHQASLGAHLVARILGRRCRHGVNVTYTADYDSDWITAGPTIVWQSGGRQLISWLLEQVSEDDLAALDYTERVMWVAHCLGRVQRGLPIFEEHAPTAWRRGQRMAQETYQAMLARVDAGCGSLARMEAQLSSALAAGGAA